MDGYKNDSTDNIELSNYCKMLNIHLQFIGLQGELIQNKKISMGAYIINLGDLNSGGTHWVCCYLDDDLTPFYFDPFGFIPSPEIINYFMKTKQRIKYSVDPVQDIKSSRCGYWCLYFLSSMKYKMNYQFFLKQFSKDTVGNEKLLVRWMKSKCI